MATPSATRHTSCCPLELTAADANRPIDLKLALEFGICKDICIPVEVALVARRAEGCAHFRAGLAHGRGAVPHPAHRRRRETERPGAQVLQGHAGGRQAALAFDVAFPGGAAGADLFVEAPDGLWVPLARKAGESGGSVRFEIDLTDGADIEALKGKTLAVTLVSDAGQSETSVQLP